MANCNICGRKESKKRVICEQKVCSECLRKLKENNYVLVNSNKDDLEALSDTSVIIEQNHLLQNEFNDDEYDILRIKSIFITFVAVISTYRRQDRSKRYRFLGW